MKYNSKVVSFDRSAAYVHHRALKNLRENNPVEALELMRHAVEHSPENQEYLLDLAEIYCELGCHEQSNRILLDMIAGENAPAECYYGLALNQFSRNELESARRALGMYVSNAGDGEYMDDAYELNSEIDYYDSNKRPADRRQARAFQAAGRACDALREDDPFKARRLFERSFALWHNQPEMRALYAMALKLCGDLDGAMRVALEACAVPELSVRTLCVSAQVLRMCGEAQRGRKLAERAIALRPEGTELRLLAFALCEMEMYDRAGEMLKLALREAPYEKELLHLRAVALYLSGAPVNQAEAFWLRILRIDPEDSVAAYYHDLAVRGVLNQVQPELVYEVPRTEYRRRLTLLLEELGEGMESALARWREDRQFQSLLLWAVGTGDENCGRAAVMVLASAGDARAESALRELLYRGNIPLAVKLHALLFLRLRGAELQSFLPPGINLQDGVLPEAHEMLKNIPVGERQLVRFAGEFVEIECGTAPVSALMAMWIRYRSNCEGIDPLVCTQEAAAALAWNYLLQHGENVKMKRLAQWFNCKPRRLVFYARRMAAVLEQVGGAQEDEDH